MEKNSKKKRSKNCSYYIWSFNGHRLCNSCCFIFDTWSWRFFGNRNIIYNYWLCFCFFFSFVISNSFNKKVKFLFLKIQVFWLDNRTYNIYYICLFAHKLFSKFLSIWTLINNGYNHYQLFCLGSKKRRILIFTKSIYCYQWRFQQKGRCKKHGT